MHTFPIPVNQSENLRQKPPLQTLDPSIYMLKMYKGIGFSLILSLFFNVSSKFLLMAMSNSAQIGKVFWNLLQN